MTTGPVDRLDVAVYTVPTDAPEADGTLAWDSTTLVLVTVGSGPTEGRGYTYASPAAATVVTEHLRQVVLGSDPHATTSTWQAMVRTLRNVGRPGVGSSALSAMDTALWDLRARLLDLPLHQLLGGAVHERVPVYGSGGFTTYDDAQTRAQLDTWAHQQGMPRVKIKIGESAGTRVDRDLARIRLARQVIGPDVELYVDANGGYTACQAVRVADAMADQQVTWFEEPVSSDDLAGLRHVRGRVAADVAAGEYGWDLATLGALCTTGAVDCLQIDVTRCGGVTELLRAAAVAAACGLDVSGHCAPSLHGPVLAAVPNLRHLEWFHDHVRIERMLFDGFREPDAGDLLPSDRPGFGLVPRPEAQRYRTG